MSGEWGRLEGTEESADTSMMSRELSSTEEPHEFHGLADRGVDDDCRTGEIYMLFWLLG